MHLHRLTAAHQDAVLEFETANRAYFAVAIADRGDGFFADYPARHAAVLAMQAAGTDHFHVLVTDTGAIAGRVNLTHIDDGEAELGYRIGQAYAGHGLATSAVAQVCGLARTDYGLLRLRAGTAATNHGSQKVLLRNGFTFIAHTTVDGRPSHLYARDLRPGDDAGR